MDLRERKQIINGATESLPEYSEGKWLHGVAKKDIPGMVTTGINFAGSAINSFGPVKSEGDILQESGTSVGQGSGFSYQKQNAVDAGAQMDELSKQNTANTLNTAATGASLGSAFGPIGAGIGGVVGGAVGFIGGLFRKNKMAERIRQAQIQATRNNNFNLASAQTDYLTNQYNVEHDNTQDDLIYSAKDGHKPTQHVYSASGYANGKPNALGSHHEWLIDTFTGEETQLPGEPDKKDTIKLKLKHPGATAIVSNNKFLDGIRNSDYYTLTKDLDGALARDQWYRDMKDYRTVKQLGYGSFNAKNGILPGFKYGKKDILADFNTAMDNASSFADTMREKNTSFKTPWEQATGGINKYWTDQDRLNRITPVKSPETPAGGNSSNWDSWNLQNNIVGAMGIARGVGQMLKSGEKVNTPDIYADNDMARQGLAILASRRPDLYARMLEAYDAEARNRYNVNRMGGLGVGQRILMAVAGGNALQKNLANIRAAANQETNVFRGDLGNATIQVGGQNAGRKQTANQYNDDARARSVGASTNFWETGANNAYKAYADTVGRTFDMNKWIEMMGRFDQEYDLKRRGLFA